MTGRWLAPRIPALLGSDELEALHWSALRVLQTVGLHVADEDCLRALEGHKGIARRGNRLHFEPDFVDAEIDKHKANAQPPAAPQDEPLRLSVGAHATHYVDLDTDEIRPLAWESCRRITRIVDGLSSRGLQGHCPGAPQELAPGLREVAQTLIGWQSCAGGGTAPATSIQSADYIHEMNEVMGRGRGIGVHLVSPLRLEGIEYEMAVRLAPQGASISVGSMPIMGVTAPVHPAGAFTISVAEVLGSWLALRLFLGVERIGFSFDAYSADLRTGSFIYGNPEQKLLDLIKRDVNAFYGASKPPRSMYSMARRPGAQSCAEMAALVTVDALCGVRRFSGVNMAIDELCCPEQYVLALEMMHSAAQMARGVRWDRTALSVEAIEEALGQGSDFMSHESTLRWYKDTYWFPELWDRRPLSQGEWGDLEPARERAKQIAREAEQASEFQLPDDKAAALQEIYRAAERAYGG